MRLENGAKECNVQISARALQRVFTCKNRRRYSRERAPRSLGGKFNSIFTSLLSYFASFGYTNANAGANRTATSSWVRSFCHRECGGRSTHFARISRKQGRPPHLHEVCGSVEGDSYESEKGAMQGFALGLEGSERQSDRRPRKTFFHLFK